MTAYLDVEDLLILIKDLHVGPIRDIGLLASAVERPRTRLWGLDAYPSIPMKAAALLDSLVNDHPLVDGNKRLGWLATAVFLALNGPEPQLSNDEAYDLVIAVAHSRMELADIAESLTPACSSDSGDADES